MNYRTPIFFGFVIALCGTILMLSLVGLDLLGPDAVLSNKEMIGGTVLFLMIYLFLLIGIYFVLKKQKEQHGGTLSFKNALTTGIITSLATACFSVIFTILFYEVLYPAYVPELLSALEEKMELENISREKITEKLLERKTYYSTSNQSTFHLLAT